MALRLILAIVLGIPLVADWSLAQEITAEQVRQAIERGIAYLSRQQKPNGSWDEYQLQSGGVTALCTLALLNAGVDPADERIQRSLKYLRAIEPHQTYAASLQTMVFCAAEPRKDLLLIQRNVRWLEQTQVKEGDGAKGGWSYPGHGGAADNSNSQFALLALHEAAHAGAEVNEQTWRLALGYWTRGQNHDGSWSYVAGGNGSGSGSMTTAGITSMVIALEQLEDGDAKVNGNQVQCCAEHEQNNAVERGLDWLGRNFSVQSNPGQGGYWLYYLYGLERTGRMTAQRFFVGPQGRYDWYREGADVLVRLQDGISGFWRGVGHAEDHEEIGTSFALLFLGKGRRPILMSKLGHGPEGDWNRHRSDVANLTRYVETRWRRDLTWQTLEPRGITVDDLLQSPVIFFNGRQRPEFTNDQVRALRDYIDRGGFIFAEACCEGNGFDTGFRQLMKRMFPEPDYELHLLDRDHPVWTIEEPVDPEHVRPLWGIDFGCRTSVMYCPEDLSCFWELARPGRLKGLSPQVRVQVAAANAIGINVLAYATNRELKYKLETPQTLDRDVAQDPFERGKLYVAKLRHTGGWNQAPAAVTNLLKSLSREAGMRVSTDRRDISLTDEKLYDYHLVFMHGRHDFRLSEAERSRLRTFLERGGMLFADSICGSPEFAGAFRREIEAVWPETPLARIPLEHPLFTPTYGGFDVRTVSRRDPQRVGADQPLKTGVRQVEPDLDGIKIGDRYAVIFSKYDLSCALENHASPDCRGYTTEDAARLGINVVLYSLHD